MLSKGRKFNKPRRGGGRHFNRDLVCGKGGIAESRASRDLVRGEGGTAESRASCRKNAIAAEPSNPLQQDLELTRARAERRELKKEHAVQQRAQKQGIDEDADLINPNHIKNKHKMSDLGPARLSRKEREAVAKERYWELHRAGKTEEAKSDLARLKKIKEEREAAQTKRKAEAEAKAAEVKKAAMSGKRI